MSLKITTIRRLDWSRLRVTGGVLLGHAGVSKLRNECVIGGAKKRKIENRKASPEKGNENYRIAPCPLPLDPCSTVLRNPPRGLQLVHDICKLSLPRPAMTDNIRSTTSDERTMGSVSEL